MLADPALDVLGRFIAGQLRDRGIAFADKTLEAQWKAPRLSQLQNELRELTREQRELVRRMVVATIDSAIHDFLFALQESSGEHRVSLHINSVDAASISDGLQGEPYSDDGWYARFSAYGAPPERA